MAWFDLVETPVGSLFVGGSAVGVHRVDFLAEAAEEVHVARLEAAAGEPALRDPAAAAEAVRQLRAYFAGGRTAFDLPLAPRGTDFQRRVWRALLDIPPGQTISYGELARRIGRPSASRAVGAANGQNPIAVVIPCHRVVGADGTLTGYGGGLHRKRWLLEHETRAMPLFAGAAT